MIKATSRLADGLLVETTMGSHSMTCDVPSFMGGTDRGPTAGQLFAASLGSCMVAVVAQYCATSGIDTAGLTVDVDCDVAFDPVRLTNIRATVHLPNADCGERLAAILRAAEQCPTHLTIVETKEISVRIVDRRGEAETDLARAV